MSKNKSPAPGKLIKYHMLMVKFLQFASSITKGHGVWSCLSLLAGEDKQCKGKV